VTILQFSVEPVRMMAFPKLVPTANRNQSAAYVFLPGKWCICRCSTSRSNVVRLVVFKMLANQLCERQKSENRWRISVEQLSGKVFSKRPTVCSHDTQNAGRRLKTLLLRYGLVRSHGRPKAVSSHARANDFVRPKRNDDGLYRRVLDGRVCRRVIGTRKSKINSDPLRGNAFRGEWLSFVFFGRISLTPFRRSND